jgi:hypothetical protein
MGFNKGAWRKRSRWAETREEYVDKKLVARAEKVAVFKTESTGMRRGKLLGMEKAL